MEVMLPVLVVIIVLVILVSSITKSDSPTLNKSTNKAPVKKLNTEAAVLKAQEIYAGTNAKNQAELESRKQKEFQRKCQLANQKLAGLGIEPLEWQEVPRRYGEFGEGIYYILESTTKIGGVRLYFYPSVMYKGTQLWTESPNRSGIYINTLEDLGRAIAGGRPAVR